MLLLSLLLLFDCTQGVEHKSGVLLSPAEDGAHR